MFAPFFAPCAASENIVNSKLALAFLRAGHEICVISRRHEIFRYGQEWCEPWLALREMTHEIHNGTGSRTQRLCDLVRSTAAMRCAWPGLRWGTRAFELAMRLHREHRFDVILSRSPVDGGHFPALFMAERTGLPWIANWNDPPYYLLPYPYEVKLDRLRYRINRSLVRTVLENADCVTFPSKRLRDYILQKSGVRAPRETAVIPHIGHDHVSGKQPPAGRKFRICHAGILSKERCPRTFLQGLSMFLAQEKAQGDVVFEVIGVHDMELKKLAEEYGVSACLAVTGPLPYLDTLSRLEQSDVLLVLEAPCDEGIFLPSKVADYACAGKPILAVSPLEGTLRDLLSEYGGGMYVSNRSAEDIGSALVSLYRNWKGAGLETRLNTEPLRQMFSERNVLSQYERLFSILCGASAP